MLRRPFLGSCFLIKNCPEHGRAFQSRLWHFLTIVVVVLLHAQVASLVPILHWAHTVHVVPRSDDGLRGHLLVWSGHLVWVSQVGLLAIREVFDAAWATCVPLF